MLYSLYTVALRDRPGMPAVAFFALLAVIALVTVLGFGGVAWQWRAAGVARDVAVEERRKARTALYFSRIAQSQLQWRVNDFPSAEQSLARCMPAYGQDDDRGCHHRHAHRLELERST